MKRLIFVFSLMILLTGCTKTTSYTETFFYMDTYIEVTIYNEENLDDVFDEVESIYSEYHELTDRYNLYDGVYNVKYLNDNSLGEFVLIDEKLYDLIDYSINMYDYTNGYFNIALGNALLLWHDYRECECGVPTYSELSNVGSNDIIDVVLNEGEVKLENGVNIDLGGIAKGYTTQKVAEFLEEQGIESYLINAGGNVKVGDSYKTEGFLIGLENPLKSSSIYKIVSLENESIITSGDYSRFYEYEGQLYHHIIDNLTLYPTEYYKSVTVIVEDSSLGDVLSTALFTIPYEEGLEYVENLNNVEAIWFISEDDIRNSSGLDKYENE